MKKKGSVLLALLIVILSVLPTVSFAAGPKVTAKEVIAPGTQRLEYTWTLKKGNVVVNVVTVDLKNPKTKVDLVLGGGKLTEKATVSQMANRTGAVALVNGDFFNTKAQGSPLGASVSEGQLVTAPMNSVGYYTLGFDTNNRASIQQVTFGGHVIAANSAKYPIQGLNKAEYWDNITGAHSHTHTINVYDEFWLKPSRGKLGKNGVEVLVAGDGTVESVANGKIPTGIPKGKRILQGNDRAADFLRNNVKKGDKIQIDYTLYPKKNWRMLIGGHGLLVDKNKALPYTLAPEAIGGSRPRTAVGINKDGDFLWIVAAEKSGRSKGLTLRELSDFLVQIGVYKGLNMDGGGSTAMSVRSLGDLQGSLATKPEGGGRERPVVNGIGVFNIAPDGPLSNIRVDGPDSLLVGEKAVFTVKGWDDNLKPKDLTKSTVAWSDDKEGKGEWRGAEKTALHTGSLTITAEVDGIRGTKTVPVKGKESIRSLDVQVDRLQPKAGEGITLRATAKTDTGRKVTIDPRALDVVPQGMEGLWDKSKGVFLVTVPPETAGFLNVSLGGYPATVSLVHPDARHISMTIGKKEYKVDGQTMTMDAPPKIVKERTMVPLRFLLEALGGEVSWNGETREVTMIYGGNRLVIPVGKSEILVNGQPQAIDSPAIILSDRTMVPIRFVSESLGMIVSYDPGVKGVHIYEKPKGQSLPAENQEPKEDQNKTPGAPLPGSPTQPVNPDGPVQPAQPEEKPVPGTDNQGNAPIVPAA